MNIKPPSTDLLIKVAIGVAVLGVGYYVVKKAAGLAGDALEALPDAVDGVLTGNNRVTQAATNSDGERVTAYEGKGILGTLGAATNTLSGGYLATFGQWLGGKTYDLLNPETVSNVTPYPTPVGHRNAYWKS